MIRGRSGLAVVPLIICPEKCDQSVAVRGLLCLRVSVVFIGLSRCTVLFILMCLPEKRRRSKLVIFKHDMLVKLFSSLASCNFFLLTFELMVVVFPLIVFEPVCSWHKFDAVIVGDLGQEAARRLCVMFHSFIPDISIASHQVHYYSEALPIRAWY